MLKVLDVFRIGDMLSVTLEGNCNNLKNGSKLIDSKGVMHDVISVAMTKNNNPKNIAKSTTILITLCDVQKDDELHIA